MIAESDYLLLFRLSARLELERDREITKAVQHSIARIKNAIILKDAYQFNTQFPIKHNAETAGCACKLCVLKRGLASINKSFHRIKKSYYDDNGINLSFDYLFTEAKNNGIATDENSFFTQLENNHKTEVKEIRSMIKAVEESIAYLLE